MAIEASRGKAASVVYFAKKYIFSLYNLYITIPLNLSSEQYNTFAKANLGTLLISMIIRIHTTWRVLLLLPMP